MNRRPFTMTTRSLIVGVAPAFALFVALFLGGTGAGRDLPAFFGQPGPAPALAQGDLSADHSAASRAPLAEQTASAGCSDDQPPVDAEPWARTELYFGTAKASGPAVTDAEWQEFLADEITERFPDGLTVMTGIGQYLDDATVVQERSMQLILLYPRESARASGAKIEEIRAEYEDQFEQESVLRSDDSLPVCVSF